MVAPDALWDHVWGIAGRLAENAPISIAASKAGINQVLRDPAARDMAELAEFNRRSMDSEDFREGRTAFMEKRTPHFIGR